MPADVIEAIEADTRQTEAERRMRLTLLHMGSSGGGPQANNLPEDAALAVSRMIKANSAAIEFLADELIWDL